MCVLTNVTAQPLLHMASSTHMRWCTSNSKPFSRCVCTERCLGSWCKARAHAATIGRTRTGQLAHLRASAGDALGAPSTRGAAWAAVGGCRQLVRRAGYMLLRLPLHLLWRLPSKQAQLMAALLGVTSAVA